MLFCQLLSILVYNWQRVKCFHDILFFWYFVLVVLFKDVNENDRILMRDYKTWVMCYTALNTSSEIHRMLKQYTISHYILKKVFETSITTIARENTFVCKWTFGLMV